VEEILEQRAPSMEVKAFWACLYFAGLRFHEAHGLKVENLDRETGEIKVVGKGGKLARVAMNDYLRPIMERIAGERKSGPCFPGLPGNEQGCLRLLRRAVQGMDTKAGGRPKGPLNNKRIILAHS
jgi:site-specific recombinase XerC